MRAAIFFLAAGLLLAAPNAGAAPRADASAGPGDEWERVVDLRGTWQFRLGDDRAWASGADDGRWESIFVPAAWEDEGFWGYDGFAWYRTTFRVAPAAAARPLYLHLGRVDDVDEVWLNGHFLGSTGRIGAYYETGYHAFRAYRIPPEYLRTRGENVLTVRVYDDELSGGILDGQPGVYVRRTYPDFEVDLAGAWRFRPGDDTRWAVPGFDDEAWGTLTVPGRWEPQGHPFLDGYAWYRTDFSLKDWDRADRVLLLGRIDDLDEVYVNGRRIGGTGRIDEGDVHGDEWQVVRAYTIPAGVLREGRNTVAVRVYDSYIDGGIYDGPVGVLRPGAYERWRAQEHDARDGFVDWLRTLFEGKKG